METAVNVSSNELEISKAHLESNLEQFIRMSKVLTSNLLPLQQIILKRTQSNLAESVDYLFTVLRPCTQ